MAAAVIACGCLAGTTAHSQAPAQAGNAAAGETAFVLCSACHEIGPPAMNSVGPVLNAVVGRKAGVYPGFDFSEANKKSGVTWDERTLAAYLPDPQKFMPGTAMPIGLQDPKAVADVIAYLKQFDAKGNKSGPTAN